MINLIATVVLFCGLMKPLLFIPQIGMKQSEIEGRIEANPGQFHSGPIGWWIVDYSGAGWRVRYRDFEAVEVIPLPKKR